LASTLADLEIATFAVGEIVEGTQTGWSDGRLTLALPQLAVGAGSQPALAEATVEVVRPGDPVRISNVLDVVLPTANVAGRLYRPSGVAVLTVCDWMAGGVPGAEELPDSIVDMAGPAADRSPWGATIDVVVRCVPASGADARDADAAVRAAGDVVARLLAEALVDAEPDAVRSIGRLPTADASLPAIAVVLQVASEGPLVDTFLDGEPLGTFEPFLLDERALYGGGLRNAAYDWPGVRNVTAAYQDPALLRELRARHGHDLRSVGIVLAPGYLDGAEQKRRAAERSAELVASLDADGVVCTTFSSGNSHTDTMLTVQACERRGIGTIALVCETNGGLTDHVPEADCLVSTGNEDELVEAWTPERVIGSAERARVGQHLPAVHYLGGLAQTGDARWTAVPA
jgi:sarcosine reductase